MEQALPVWARNNYNIQNLVHTYQKGLINLNASHNLLSEDYGKFSKLIQPFLSNMGQIVRPPSEDLLLMKQGLDLRLLEFDADCLRLQKVEAQLQRLLDDTFLQYEQSVTNTKSFVEEETLQKIQEQQRLIHLQFHELDEIRFQRDLYLDEIRRLKKLVKFGTTPLDLEGRNFVLESTQIDQQTLRKLYSSNPEQANWMSKIRVAKKPPARSHLRPFPGSKETTRDAVSGGGFLASIFGQGEERKKTRRKPSALSSPRGGDGASVPSSAPPQIDSARTPVRLYSDVPSEIHTRSQRSQEDADRMNGENQITLSSTQFRVQLVRSPETN
eukprot:Gregarina_sp_Poly_1__10266@NODE_719_length_6614_cov_137_436383_g541_i0_p3_GENE_NODE_719_length_6614_cov_137_436383_g541_i0NODE_719_length_6614_cov_137_436383_g541_i0_p3_ORF_typecomplete_len328_score54_79DUF2076/PF09849_9/0_012RuvB_C/PF05491_13/0_07Herpes_US12/PF05363_12/1_4e03Herpes_US12/PF05363_12/0_28_NODE_719_length_6614_cov_137_436383_g541_i050766059